MKSLDDDKAAAQGPLFVFIPICWTLPDHDRPVIDVMLSVLLLLSPKVNHFHLI